MRRLRWVFVVMRGWAPNKTWGHAHCYDDDDDDDDDSLRALCSFFSLRSSGVPEGNILVRDGYICSAAAAVADPRTHALVVINCRVCSTGSGDFMIRTRRRWC